MQASPNRDGLMLCPSLIVFYYFSAADFEGTSVRP